MDIDRRRLIALSALTGAVPAATLATPAGAAPLSTLGVDATKLGVRAGGGAEQTAMLQSAIDQTAGARVPLVLGPGEYRVGELKLPTGAQIVGVRGATRLIFTGGAAMISARGADHVTLAGLVLDGAGKPLPDNGALVHFAQGSDLRIVDCEVRRSSRQRHRARSGRRHGLRQHRHQDAADAAIFSRDARGLDDPGQHRARRRQRRHPGPALGKGRRRHAGHRQPHRGHRQHARRLRPVRQRHQRVPRRQRDRARQPHQPRRVHRRCAATPPPTSRSSATPRPTSARSRSIPNSASRAR